MKLQCKQFPHFHDTRGNVCELEIWIFFPCLAKGIIIIAPTTSRIDYPPQDGGGEVAEQARRETHDGKDLRIGAYVRDL